MKLAQSGTIEGITALISEYYYGSTITLSQINDKQWQVFNKLGKIEGAYVIKRGNKYTFNI